MSAESNAVRALADSGTPGEWRADRASVTDLHFGEMPMTHIYAGDKNLVAVPSLLLADATKAAIAVNALPKVAGLIAVLWRHQDADGYCGWCCGEILYPCDHARARDALTAALGVTE